VATIFNYRGRTDFALLPCQLGKRLAALVMKNLIKGGPLGSSLTKMTSFFAFISMMRRDRIIP
jgi:hypothetical protein